MRHAIQFSFCLQLLLIAGCSGYRQSGDFDREPQQGYQWRSLYREDIQTVSIPIFVNKSFTRGVEFGLSEAVAKQLEAHAPYKVVSNTKADTVLEGEIVAVQTRTVSNSLTSGIPQEQLASIKVNFIWKDLRNGKILVERRGFEQAAAFYPTLGEGRSQGQRETIERLALAIVQELQADW